MAKRIFDINLRVVHGLHVPHVSSSLSWQCGTRPVLILVLSLGLSFGGLGDGTDRQSAERRTLAAPLEETNTCSCVFGFGQAS